MNKPFKLTDIVVFDGVISTFGVFYALDIAVVDNFKTQIRHATEEELNLYKNRPDL
jgi:hypothetical protein